jgi:CRISPR-associated protein Cas2
MYVLLVYDVEVARVTKVHKFLKRHMHWVQNSVFEGELTEAQIETVKAGLRRLLSEETDSVLIYTARDRRWLSRETLGRERGETGNLL